MEPVELQLTYGNAVRRTVRFEGGVRLADDASGLVGDQSLTALEAAVHQALSQPIEFPSVEQAIVPGDRVVLAVDATVPRVADVVCTVIEYLQQKGVATEQFAVVLAGHAELDVSELSRRLPGEVGIELHDADDQTKVAYVAANKQGEPIYMNRTLVDADVVIPIMCARGRLAIDYEGAYGVFPLLTDRRTRGQFYSLRQLADPGEHERLTRWADEAAWWVGLLVAIQVIPGVEGGIARILAGDPQMLEQEVQRVMHELWQSDINDTYDSVLALIDGGATQQTWDSVARVLAATTPLVKQDGALIICSQLSDRPGSALAKLGDPNRLESGLARQLSHDSADDALAAAVLLESLESAHVYLLSELPGELLEPIGVTGLEDMHQVEHISVSVVIVWSSAQHSIARSR